MKTVQIRSFFWSVFSRIRTEYGDILCISPYSVRVRENTDQKNLHIWTLFTQCRTDMNVKVLVFFIYVEAIMHLLLYNLHDCTFNF